MRVFISYSTPDLNLVHQIAKSAGANADVKFWAKDKEPGQDAWPTIFSWIDASDLVLVLITGHTVARAMAVGNEVGRAKAKGKLVIPLVSPGIPQAELGCLNGVTYEHIDPFNPMPALKRINALIASMAQKLATQQGWLWLGGTVALLLLFASNGKK